MSLECVIQWQRWSRELTSIVCFTTLPRWHFTVSDLTSGGWYVGIIILGFSRYLSYIHWREKAWIGVSVRKGGDQSIHSLAFAKIQCYTCFYFINGMIILYIKGSRYWSMTLEDCAIVNHPHYLTSSKLLVIPFLRSKCFCTVNLWVNPPNRAKICSLDGCLLGSVSKL